MTINETVIAKLPPEDGGGGVVRLELRRRLTPAQIEKAYEQAKEEHVAKLQHGAPGEFEPGMRERGGAEVVDSCTKRRIVSIDGAPFDQKTSNEEFRRLWSDRQWARLTQVVAELG